MTPNPETYPVLTNSETPDLRIYSVSSNILSEHTRPLPVPQILQVLSQDFITIQFNSSQIKCLVNFTTAEKGVYSSNHWFDEHTRINHFQQGKR